MTFTQATFPSQSDELFSFEFAISHCFSFFKIESNAHVCIFLSDGLQCQSIDCHCCRSYPYVCVVCHNYSFHEMQQLIVNFQSVALTPDATAFYTTPTATPMTTTATPMPTPLPTTTSKIVTATTTTTASNPQTTMPTSATVAVTPT